MAYVRLVHPREFDHTLDRFGDLAFKNSKSGVGMSIFECRCAEVTSGGICAHVGEFYANVSGEPPVFYLLEEDELPAGYEIVPTLSDSGDECHREVGGVSNNRLYAAFKKKRHWSNFYVCDGNGGYRKLTDEDLRNFRR